MSDRTNEGPERSPSDQPSDAASEPAPEEPDAGAPLAAPNGSVPLERAVVPSAAIVVDEAPPSLQREALAKPPLLASEALMEDLAPMNPARGAARIWCAAVGLGFLLLGVLPATGLRAGGAMAGMPAFMLGIVALFAALTRVTYRQRAVAMVVLGSIAAIIGLRGAGPAAGIAQDNVGWGAARAIAAVALPAALVFRSRYRAYAGARWLLVGAFLVALPSLGHAVARITPLDPHIGHLGAVAVLLAVLASLTGFMGAETTGAGTFVAVAVVIAFALDLLIGGLVALSSFSIRAIVDVLAAALAFAATSAITSLGLFQILAFRLAADARRIDLHSRPKDAPTRPQSGGEWLT